MFLIYWCTDQSRKKELLLKFGLYRTLIYFLDYFLFW
jgi:hypothetical protein